LAIRIFWSTHDNVRAVGADEQIRPPDPPFDGPSGERRSGWTIRRVAETGSTNADLVSAAAEGAPHRTVLVAGHQTAGRGRLDRRWEAPPGANLLVSILFREVPAAPAELTQRVSLAALAACRAVAGVAPTLKWPNDLVLDERKLAGVLAQRAPDGSVVVGIGVNVGWAPEGAARLGDATSPDQLLGALLDAYDSLPDEIGPAYRAALATLTRRVRVELFDGAIEGTAIDVEADGRLVVLDDCAQSHRIDVGDVVHLRPVLPPSTP
jgi:BirA family transcriptional regulator, biotin operon repressor / biotin---[acetyl-CoA-carboxylase] ligase